MKTYRFLMVIAFLCCISANYLCAQEVTKEQLADKWTLKKINNRDVNEIFTHGVPPYMLFNFDIDQVSGNVGCNMFSGNFTYKNGEFQMPNYELGNVNCPNKESESMLIGLLNGKSTLAIMNGELIFTQNGRPALVFVRAQPLTMNNLNGTWTLMSINSQEAGKDFGNRLPHFQFNFDQNRIAGNAGCNTFNTTFTLSKNVLDIQPLVTTRMSCDNMDAENRFVNMFSGRMDVDIVDGYLTFWKDNKKIMTFKK